jgi:ligand-binding sensor domain-containing protein
MYLSVYQDRSGILWIGNDNVLNRLDRKTGRYTFFRHNPASPGSISNGSVASTIEDRSGTLWFGTFGGGLNRFDRRTGRFKAYRNNPADSGSLSSDRVLTAFLDHAEALWVGTGNGLNRFDPKSERFTVFQEPSPSPVSQIIEDEDGIFWLCTVLGGIRRFDPSSGLFTAYRHDPKDRTSLSNDHVNALCIDRAGALWVGTQSGLNRFDRHTNKFTAVYFASDGLRSNAVQGIEEGGRGNLWLSTNNGLSRFNPKTGECRNYYDSYGLAGNDFGIFIPAFSKSSDGELFFGGVDGVTAFYPDIVDSLHNSYVPPVVLTDFQLNNVSVPIRSASVLKTPSPMWTR